MLGLIGTALMTFFGGIGLIALALLMYALGWAWSLLLLAVLAGALHLQEVYYWQPRRARLAERQRLIDEGLRQTR